MRRLLLTTVTVVAFLLLTVAPSMAGNPHFSKNGSPVCTVSVSGSSVSVVCEGDLAGLGNGDLLLETTISGFSVYECQNHGGNTAPGQNRVLEGPVTAPTFIPSDAIKNGRVAFTTDPATLTAAETVSAAIAGCPATNWTGVNPVLTLTNIDLDISQAGILLFSCSASDPNGLSGTVSLTC